ncbi:hypothetical protein PR001_g3902 [Phytophthora rubi]|uniref:Uncharacterized protein n=1 Tax=Phytophthora rubi TaxID=129364 RepID=A0A6A3NS37_9STRA|nr:hypothetical protein PR001_g3902 [Phytophthora rubi]
MAAVAPTSSDLVGARPRAGCRRASTSALLQLWQRMQLSYYGGRYSIQRVLAFDEYTRRTSLARVVFVCFATPVPMVALVFGQELVPLQELSEGWSANYGMWLRAAVMVGIVTHALLVQGMYLIDNFVVSVRQMLQLYVIMPMIMVGLSMIMSAYLVFPIPFYMLLVPPPFYVLLVVILRVVVGARAFRQMLAHRVQLPNVKYHLEMEGVTRENVVSSVVPLVIFGLLQFLSFAMSALLIRRNCGMEALYQLAFVLETQRSLIQCKMMLWMVTTLCFRVTHFGVDFKLEFIRLGFPKIWYPHG